jgi:uncharacterized membrane protein required for colicin V production
MWLALVFILIFVACIGILYHEGMWNNAIRLVNVVTAALLATSFYELVATKLDSYLSSFTFAWDFLALWGVFAVCILVMRELTDRISTVKVRFLNMADQFGGIFFAACIGWVLICFTAMSLHTAPLARNFFFGSFKPEQRLLMGLAPDRQWLGFAQQVSRGQFCRSPARVFDEKSEFPLRYATRRAKVQTQIETVGSLSISQ